MSDKRRSGDRRADALDAVIDGLATCRKRMPRVDQLMDDMAAGFGGSRTTEVIDDPDCVDCPHEPRCRVEITYRSSTEAAALNPQRDKPGAERRRREQILKELAKLANELDDIEREFLGGGDGTKPPDPAGCEVVGRFKGKDGKRLWAPVDRQTDGTAFLVNAEAEFHKGQSIGVSTWAFDFGRRVGRWPNRTEVEKHLRGEVVVVAPLAGARQREGRRFRGWRRQQVA